MYRVDAKRLEKIKERYNHGIKTKLATRTKMGVAQRREIEKRLKEMGDTIFRSLEPRLAIAEPPPVPEEYTDEMEPPNKFIGKRIDDLDIRLSQVVGRVLALRQKVPLLAAQASGKVAIQQEPLPAPHAATPSDVSLLPLLDNLETNLSRLIEATQTLSKVNAKSISKATRVGSVVTEQLHKAPTSTDQVIAEEVTPNTPPSARKRSAATRSPARSPRASPCASPRSSPKSPKSSPRRAGAK